MSTKYTLNTELRLEPILLSLTDDNYSTIISQLSSGIYDFDKDTVNKLNKYLWLVDSQLGKHVAKKETLKNEFPELLFDDYTGIDNIDELTDYIYMYITQKKQRFISAKLGALADTIRSQGLADGTVEEIYKYLSLAETESGYTSVVSNFRDMYDKHVKMQGLSFQCPELDKLTGGIMPGQICTILGFTGSMKTTYASNISYGAIKDGKNVLFLSLEEQPLMLYSKWLSRVSVDVGKPIPSKDITQKNLEEKDSKILFDEVVPYFEKLPGKLYIVGENDLSDYSLSSLEAKFKEVDKLAKSETGHGIDLLVVDHIQLLKFAVAGLSESTVINMYVSFFRQQSLSWLHEKRGIIVLLLSQANREGNAYAQKHDGMYLSQHVAEASEVERASAYIISVYTDNMIQMTKQLKVGAVKLRGSQLPSSTVTVYADGSVYQVGDTVIPEQMDYSTTLDFENNYTPQQSYSEEDLFASGVLDPLPPLP